MNFKVGDVCEIVNGKNDVRADYLGLECVVLSLSSKIPGKLSIEVPAKPSGHRDGYAAFPDNIRKKRPPSNYDGDQAGDWDLCPWQPAKVREHG